MLYSIYALVISMVITAIFLPWLIVFMHMHHEGQPIREEGPKAHLKKAGTPTMGGTVFVIASVIATTLVLVWKQSFNNIAIILIIALLGHGLIGFLDDGLKIIWKNNLGLRAWQKLLLQIFIAIVLVLIASFDHFAFSLRMPWGGTLTGPAIFVLFTIFWLVGFSNAVNLSDGLDGLATGLSIVSFATYAYLAFKQENLAILVFCMSVIGGLIIFLVFNHKPAKIFMGDAGSLALGGSLAAIAILLNRPWSLLLVGLVFVCETASVMIQVTSFKLTHKRVFKMTPIHHHFELSGWSEWKVDIVFWLVQLIFSILYLIIWG
ncbi:phospho-N-acetylmuramoyl-pentapeptide-transferase [Lactobacillus mulieris]|uniref:Phospho-N-acetylmuramoyl-pentapeptide-transferase n=1 Tax=Lactobacillus mulieris TaxID=2508708 RepID=A0AAW5WY84_9LACO|nr:phospho-N-acetylmuramoyl-pentapeptide-transferase [Lactobacillus mulieris]MCZ3622265.1 phospho-N-acetylmuramoyl-pentapeptide-transferase [Lactobacillus mulieris]MCZ3623947.1 phospho-N-acetylmuramoyl-pentapeptide-transferase [Lactobacillus mulieris]MCZ3636272.1 phospho-N-acetylmuramoyl-pentapeptide-transferase [Lactobacillus mulieris]MCZ3689816.1 phospho-N-acetylmuramoyl-pentapeptide-transferase [Lactobacillus mulieris]MCZ3695819.1 phospho-N-acetylmuramoyl-pentapeptide-transferase [Lactobaci